MLTGFMKSVFIAYGTGGDLLTGSECLNIIREKEMKHAADLEEAIQSC